MELHELLQFCERWDRLGTAVQKQLHDVVTGGEDVTDQNPNAMKLAAEFLRFCHKRGIDGADEILARIADVAAANT